MEIKIELLGNTVDKDMKNVLLMLLEGQKLKDNSVKTEAMPIRVTEFRGSKQINLYRFLTVEKPEAQHWPNKMVAELLGMNCVYVGKCKRRWKMTSYGRWGSPRTVVNIH